MGRWKIICSYDGTNFSGWQSQPSRDAVQDEIESALAKIFHHSTRIHGASRTDAGVHACGQCFHFDQDWNHSGEALLRAANTKLPSSIRLLSTLPVNESFHARFSAVGKQYEYHFSTREVDPFSTRYQWHISQAFDADKFRAVLPCLAGAHDFSAYAGKVNDAETPSKTLNTPELWNPGQGEWIFRVEGSGFLYRMVRSLVGTLVRVAIGKLPPNRIPELLEEKKRTPEVHTAPAQGLFLNQIYYADDERPGK